MKKRFQVFISSTFQDLQPARQEVSQALLRSGCFPAGMELFPAADEEQFSYIKEIIDESDYYIIISAGRYGSIEPKSGLSYTELEYDYALRREKPIIRLLHANPFNELRGEFIEKTDVGRQKLEAFREKMKDGRLVRFWREPKELGAEVVHGIEDAKKRRPAQGWIRADNKSVSYDELRDSVIDMGAALRVGTDVFLEQFPYAVLRTNQHREIVYANTAARKLSNGDLEIGTKLDDIFKGIGKPISDILSLNNKAIVVREMIAAEFDGVEKNLEVSLNRLDDLDGSFLAVLNDVTELKTLESQFVQSQKMQAIGQLAGGVAHDFNNLLTAISGHCDLLLLRHDQGDTDYGDLVQINQNSNRAASLVGQLLAFSRKQTLRPETLCINDLISDLSHLLNRLVGEKVTIKQASMGKYLVRADKRQLEQVMMNLIVNSRDAMPNGGLISIDVGVFETQTSKVFGRATIPAGRYVKVRVVDQGIGIPDENLDRVFEPFFTTKKTGEGTGLGLSTAYGIIKQSGGFIFAESEVEVGAIFEILLPESLESVKKEKPVKPRQNFKQQSRNHGIVVYAEDEAAVRAFGSKALRMRGFTVLEAADGTEALALLKEHGGSVDGFVTDIVMPKMDGPAWVAEALKSYPNIPILFVSGYSKEDFWDRIEHLPNYEFLPKPFSLAEITDAVSEMMLDRSDV